MKVENKRTLYSVCSGIESKHAQRKLCTYSIFQIVNHFCLFTKHKNLLWIHFMPWNVCVIFNFAQVWEISKINIQETYMYLLILQFQEKTDEVTNKFLDKRKDSYQSKPQPLATVHIDEDSNEIKHSVIYFWESYSENRRFQGWEIFKKIQEERAIRMNILAFFNKLYRCFSNL